MFLSFSTSTSIIFLVKKQKIATESTLMKLMAARGETLGLQQRRKEKTTARKPSDDWLYLYVPSCDSVRTMETAKRKNLPNAVRLPGIFAPVILYPSDDDVSPF
ncbi:hypothetical protein SDJN03_10480, partial [Cucurbita argyrosperma subsp. sororia]